ncbi:MAG: hybrid sensor histidine kinase/response regulator [Chloroflexota bacterium]
MKEKTILVVEDNPTMAEGISDVLEMEGYRVVEARNGLEGLQRLKEGGVDLILADIMMPLMDGYDFHTQVRENAEWAAIPFIFLTAKGQKEDVRHGKQLGADDYLVKPFDPTDLTIAVESKLRRASEMKQAAERGLDTLKHNILNALSHEFRTPLTYIQGYADLLLDGDPANEPEIFKDFLERIRAGSQRIHRLVEDFIFLVSLESGEITSAIEQGGMTTDLLPSLRAEVMSFQQRMQEKDISLHTEWSANLPPVFTYPPLVCNAMGRLIDNAIKFCPAQGGEIWISAGAVGGQVRITVRDNGMGIPEEEQSRIFDRFYQVNRELYEQQGVGLGLSIAQAIIDLHGGQIEVQSTPASGSAFTIALPVAG